MLALTVMAMAILGPGTLGGACDLELSLRTHSKVILWGDPLYVEVTLSDRTADPFSPAFLVPQRRLWAARLSLTFSFVGRSGTFEFRQTYRLDPEEWDGPEVAEPGQSVRYYCCLLVPPPARWNDAFWREAVVTGGVHLAVAYQAAGASGSTVLLTSQRWPVVLEARPDAELAALAFWHREGTGGQVPEPGPTPADFGLPLQVVNGGDLGDRVRQVRFSGELRDVLAVSVQLRELFKLPAQARDQGNRRLLDYLRAKPDYVTHFGAPPWVIAGVDPEGIAKLRAQKGPPFQFLDARGTIRAFPYDVCLKRRVMAGKVRSIALRYGMASTARAMEELIGDLHASGGQNDEPSGK